MALDIELLTKYEWLGCIPGLQNDGPTWLAQFVSKANELLASVKAPKADDEATKEDDPFVKACKADKDAETKANEILRKFGVSLLENVNDPHVWYHLRHSSVLTDILRTEVEWAAHDFNRNRPTVATSTDTKAQDAEDYRAIRSFANLYLSMIAVTPETVFPAGTVTTKDGNLTVNLEPLKGNYGTVDGVVATGKYAKTYQVNYKVGDATFTDPKDAIRAIWTGSNRVGKSTATLFALVDPVWDRVNKGESISFDDVPDAGNKFSVVRSVKE